jgi:hypothetical protein
MRVFQAEVLTVAIAVETDQRLERRNLMRSLHSPAEVPGVPYLVHRLQELPERLVENPVRI